MRPGTLLAHNGARIFGGAERWTVRLLAGLQARGHRVVYLCRDEEMVERAGAMGVPAEVARLGGHPVLPDAARFAWILRRHAPDGLLLSTFKKTWLGGMGARLARVPRVVARIGLATDLPGRRWVYGTAFRRWIHRVVVNADAIRGPVLADLPGLDPARVITVYNGVRRRPLAREPGAVRGELGIGPGTPVVGTVARLAEQKRLELLLAAVERLGGVHCVLAGDGPERGRLEERARTAALEGRVHFLGHREDVGDVMDALDVFALTSRTEGMSNAMLEALAAGVPVVSTPVSGAREALDPLPDGRAPGLVVDPDPESVGGALERLLGDRALRESMGAAALERVRDRFDQDRKVEVWERLLGGDTMAVAHEGPSPLRPGSGAPGS